MRATKCNEAQVLTGDRLIVPLDSPEALDVDRVGPKAANLAALGRAGLPIPGGFCLTADAYRLQLAEVGAEEAVQRAASAELSQARRLAVEIRLKLYQQPIAPAISQPLLDAWHRTSKPGVVRSSALIEDRAGANFAGQFESFLGL